MISQKLVAEQYKSPHNLQARVRLHQRFSTNNYNWALWVFDQFDLPESCRILELGCGPGGLWRTNGHRTPDAWSIALSDRSAGMIAQAAKELAGTPRQFALLVSDAVEIPFGDGCFDAVVANHMLYHVANLAQTLGEISRVLKRSGRLYAATNGARHMQELDDLKAGYVPTLSARVTAPFSLENGGDSLEQFFAPVQLRRHDNALIVTEVEPLVDYVWSGFSTCADQLPAGEPLKAAFAEHVRAVMREQGGAIRITKDQGLFIAFKEGEALGLTFGN